MDKQNYMCDNFHYMLRSCGKMATTLAEEEDQHADALLSKNTILKFKEPVDESKVKASTIQRMVQIYNRRMHTDITVDDFKYKDLSRLEAHEGCVDPIGRELVGDYIAFYLGASGYGEMLGMYIRIKEGPNSNIVAQAIHKIWDIDALMEVDADALFSGDIEANLETFMNQHQSMRKNSKYFFGTVSRVGPCASINLTTKRGLPQCQVFLHMKGYWEEKSAELGRSDSYRGGLGIAVATNSRGTYCMRIGLVRKDLATNAFFAQTNEIKELLKTSAGPSHGEWLPLILSETLDAWWYNSFMKYWK